MNLSKYLKELSLGSSTICPSTDKLIVVGNLKRHPLDVENFYHLSPLADDGFSKYEVGSEEGVLALLLNYCFIKSDEGLEDFLDELDVGYLSAECSIGEEEFEELSLQVKGKKTTLYICQDLEFHPRAENIAKILSMIAYYCEFEIVYNLADTSAKEVKLSLADEISELLSYDGAVVCFVDGKDKLFGSKQFALANKIQNGDKVSVKLKDKQIQREFVLDKSLKGTTGFLEVDGHKDTYAYEVSRITRIANE